MMCFSVALVVVVVALLLAALHLTEGRAESRRVAGPLIVEIIALAVGISSVVTG